MIIRLIPISVLYSECHLDKYNNVDSKFISQLLRGDKASFKSKDINRVTLPFYAELSMDKLIEEIKNDDDVKKYLHDDFETKKRPSR